MNKLIGCFLVLLGLSSSAFASKIDTLEVYSASMKKNIKNLVITPDSYSLKADSYSVVYLLHGAGGNFKDCLKKMPDIKTLHKVHLICC